MRQWKAMFLAGSLALLTILGSGVTEALAQSTSGARADASRASLSVPASPSQGPGATTATYLPSAYPPEITTPATAPNVSAYRPGSGVSNAGVPLSDSALSRPFEPVPDPRPAKRPSALRRLFGARTTASNDAAATAAPKRKRVKHSYIDPSTGSTKLPLSKPWLKPVW